MIIFAKTKALCQETFIDSGEQDNCQPNFEKMNVENDKVSDILLSVSSAVPDFAKPTTTIKTKGSIAECFYRTYTIDRLD